VPEKNENRESTRFADLAQIFTAYFSDKGGKSLIFKRDEYGVKIFQ
jgi:hypothetical protein